MCLLDAQHPGPDGNWIIWQLQSLWPFLDFSFTADSGIAQDITVQGQLDNHTHMSAVRRFSGKTEIRPNDMAESWATDYRCDALFPAVVAEQPYCTANPAAGFVLWWRLSAKQTVQQSAFPNTTLTQASWTARSSKILARPRPNTSTNSLTMRALAAIQRKASQCPSATKGASIR